MVATAGHSLGRALRKCKVREPQAMNDKGMTQPEHQQAIYRRRFAGIEKRRAEVWQTLAHHYFNRWIKPTDTVLDLGAGYCEFINSISAAQKYALDSNPATADKAAPGVTVLSQEATEAWSIPSESIDVVFSSNFFEHLPSKGDFSHCLAEAHRVLRPQGLLIALGPNIRFCFNVYWDFVDHHLPLSDRSVVEALEVAGFRTELVIPRFLPVTMSHRVPHRAFLVRLYLLLPLAQRFWGKQFLVVARKPKQ
jgi:SAM-dependent methyltransferase